MNALRARAREVVKKLFIPRFKVGEFHDLWNYMARYGVVFSQPPLEHGLVIVHGAELRVTAGGVEAVAVTTGIPVEGVEVEEEEEEEIEEFKVDRPCIFTLRTGSVTEFMGCIYDVEDPIQTDCPSSEDDDIFD